MTREAAHKPGISLAKGVADVAPSRSVPPYSWLGFAAALLAVSVAQQGLAQGSGLTDVGTAASPAFADIDDDGDFDAFVGEQFGNTNFFQNTGTASAPAFSAPTINPFGLAGVGLAGYSTFADIDDDDDLDAFIGNGLEIFFFENVGTSNSPSFAIPISNPFGLVDVGYFSTVGALPGLGDIDDDGDLDMVVVGATDDASGWVLFENIGTPSEPSFAEPVFPPFGSGYAPDFIDIDDDGDLDAFVGSGSGETHFLENNGTPSVPSFRAPVIHPFGLVDVGNTASPTFVDIDADLDLDAFVGNHDGNVIVFENAGTTTTPSFTPPDCADGLDNDGDSRIDAPADPGCMSSVDTSELSTVQCDNGIDDDRDGKIDWRGDGTGDPNCGSLTGPAERFVFGGGCGLGPELLLAAPLLATAGIRRRRRAAACKPGS